MEDNNNSGNEDEITMESNAKKKQKLNDGSSQESINNEQPSTSMQEDENVDSGVGADKSESTSIEEPGTSEAGISNIEVSLAASTSSGRAVLNSLNSAKKERNYRKRKSSSSNESDGSHDSDDSVSSRSNDLNHQPEPGSDVTPDEYSSTSSDNDSASSSSTDGTGSSYELPADVPLFPMDHYSDDDDGDGDGDDDDEEENEGNKRKKPAVLLKEKPQHKYLITREIINREMGMTFPLHKTADQTNVKFEDNFYGALNTVLKLSRLHLLNKHRGCVNSISFHPDVHHLLASGSDDMCVVVWDWARNKPLQTIKTGHKSNVFQSRFLYLNAMSQLNIVTCARDGQVRLLQCPPSGGTSATRRRLACHTRAAHKLHVTPRDPHSVLSAGEDGQVLRSDVRDVTASRLIHVKDKGHSVPLYSVHGHPIDTQYIMVAGRDKFIRVYDTRKSNKCVQMFAPTAFVNNVASTNRYRPISHHLTCAVYNYDGTEILGSYNDEDIYLFNTKQDVYEKDSTKLGYTHRYSGHRNSATFKGVAFYGPKSEYVMSGSDCSYVYVWDKALESIVQWMPGDLGGVVNCIETHPKFPVVATSGLDKDVKIWIPNNVKGPDFEKLERIVKENESSLNTPLMFNDFLPTLYSAWRDTRAMAMNEEASPRRSFGGHIEFDGNVCTTF